MRELTVIEAAEKLGVDPARVRRLVLDGRLRARKPSERIILIDPASVAGFVRLPAGRPKKEKPAKTRRSA